MDINNVTITGRLTKDPVITNTSTTKVAKFTIASNKTQDQANFISIVCFGKTADIVENYCKSGKKVGIEGFIQTGSYEKDGRKIYTTDIVANKLVLMDSSSINTVDTTKQATSMIEDCQVDDGLPF